MRIWIIGAQGLLGRSLHRLCIQRGLSCLGSSRLEADVRDGDGLKKIATSFAPTHIVNCAAFTDVDLAETQIALAHQINAEGPALVAEAALEVSAKVVHISTDYVFDGKASSPYTETQECRPLGIYGNSKREGESRLLERLPSACIVRTSWLYGDGGKNFLSSLLSLMEKKRVVKVASDQRGKVTFSKDLAEAVLSLLPHSGIFHFANEGECSRYEVALYLYEEAKKQKRRLFCEEILPVEGALFSLRAPRPSYSVLGTEKIQRMLEKRPRSWKESIREYLNDVK